MTPDPTREQPGGSKLSANQRRMLRAIVRTADHYHRTYTTSDGNEDRTARSLVRRRLAYWTPEGTHAGLLPTYAGRMEAGR